ncbi:MAG: ABC transporter substrate-binding protein [archaeon]
MNKNKNKLWVFGIITLIALIILVLITTKTNNEKTIKIGSILAISGDAGSYGRSIQNAISLAIEEINKNGGIDGKQIILVSEDGKCNGKDSVTAIRKLIDVDKINIVIGGMCSGETIASAPIAEENKVILFSPASGAQEITYLGDYIFRNMPSDSSSANKIAEVAIKNKNYKIAIIAENTDYGEALAKTFKNKFSSLNGQIITDERINPDQRDYSTNIKKVLSKNFDALYIITQTEATLDLILKELEINNFSGQIYGTEFSGTEKILINHKEISERTVYAIPYFDENNALAKKLLENLKLKYNEDSKSIPKSYLARAYDSVYILSEAIDYCGTDKDTECIKSYLYNIKDREGASGKLTIDKNGDPIYEFELKIIKDGKVEDYN